MREFYVIEVVECQYCDGGIVTIYEIDNNDGLSYQRYLDCPHCKGTGKIERRVSLVEALETIQESGS